MKIIRVKGIEDFIKKTQKDWHQINTWVFRGVHDASFTLRPSIGRYPRKDKEDESFILNVERNLLRNFQRQSMAYTSIKPIGDLDWMCLARHHGLSTRLLDWTYNPLVALYFAAYPDTDTDFAVYIYWINTWMGDPWKLTLEKIQKLKESHLLEPRLISPRLVNQSSIFLVCHAPWKDFDAKYNNIRKYIFPYSERAKIRHYLNMLGINQNFITPGLDGISNVLNDKYLMQNKFSFPLPPPSMKIKRILDRLNRDTKDEKS
ncbi:MAG TPA: FRG domain-containing protein [Bacteroidales bacterium]|nr:FRG domain-containing protein [Bacteroidales bacterium]